MIHLRMGVILYTGSCEDSGHECYSETGVMDRLVLSLECGSPKMLFLSSLNLALLARESFMISEQNLFPSAITGGLLASPSGKCLKHTLIWGLTSSSRNPNASSQAPHLSVALGKQCSDL